MQARILREKDYAWVRAQERDLQQLRLSSGLSLGDVDIQECFCGDWNQSLPLIFLPGKLADIKMTTQGEHDLISGLIEGHCANAEI